MNQIKKGYQTKLGFLSLAAIMLSCIILQAALRYQCFGRLAGKASIGALLFRLTLCGSELYPPNLLNCFFFLSCLCGSEQGYNNLCIPLSFLSCLCGSELQI
ncbi:hypothetical protein [Facilibium subflavum]|uniref:hypothetical protein n=1 Tax=Facilibium subflavum TaxID=2219058 RepID=UPI0013C32C0F|nr:hypothetical protein [Facilibium subflavum]